MSQNIAKKFGENMKKQQVIFIHGGDSWENNEAYLDFLNSAEPDDTNAEPVKKWTASFEDCLGDGYQLIKPRMPCSWNAKYNEWKIWFEKYFPYFHDKVVLVGFSLGGVFLAKYLSKNTFPKDIESLHLLAAPFGDRSCIKRSSFALSESLEKLAEQVSNIHLYHSKDDDVVDFGDFEVYAEALPKAQKHIFEDSGHFQIEEFPELIEEITS